MHFDKKWLIVHVVYCMREWNQTFNRITWLIVCALFLYALTDWSVCPVWFIFFVSIELELTKDKYKFNPTQQIQSCDAKRGIDSISAVALSAFDFAIAVGISIIIIDSSSLWPIWASRRKMTINDFELKFHIHELSHSFARRTSHSDSYSGARSHIEIDLRNVYGCSFGCGAYFCFSCIHELLLAVAVEQAELVASKISKII